MTISFVKPSLQSLDSIQADVLVVGLYTNERPPMGLTGLLDWRLCGYVSDLLVEDKISTAVGEATLFPSYGRLTFPRVCAFGFGDPDQFTSGVAKEVSARIVETVYKLRVNSCALSLPGSYRTNIAPRVRMELLLGELTRVFSAQEPTLDFATYLIEPVDLHRELNEIVSVATRQWRGIW